MKFIEITKDDGKKLYLSVYAIAHIEEGCMTDSDKQTLEFNRVFGFKGIKNASSLLNNERKQVEYACYMIKYLKSNFKTKKQYITAYNMGIGSVKKGKSNNYYAKFLKARSDLKI